MVSAGHSHSAAITEGASASLYMWGANQDCRLLIDEHESKFLPTFTLLEKLKEAAEAQGSTPEAYEPIYVSLGVTHSGVITRSGELFTGGSKADGQLGL